MDLSYVQLIYLLTVLLSLPINDLPYTTWSLEERVERAKRLLADKQAQKAKEETEKSKSQEAERREMGMEFLLLTS